MTTPDKRAEYAANERYNRRTRALERQAVATERIAYALSVLALAQAAQTSTNTSTGGSQSWTPEYGETLMTRLTAAVDQLPL